MKYAALDEELLKDFCHYLDELEEDRAKGKPFNEKEVMWASHLGTILLTLWHPATKAYIEKNPTLMENKHASKNNTYMPAMNNGQLSTGRQTHIISTSGGLMSRGPTVVSDSYLSQSHGNVP